MLVLFGMMMGCNPATENTGVGPSPPATVPWAPVMVEPIERLAFADLLSEDPTTGAAAVFPADTVAVQGDEVRLFDSFGAEQRIAFDLDPIQAAAWWDDTLLLATETSIVGWNNGLVETQLDAVLSGVTDLLPLRSGLWIAADEGLSVQRSGVLSTVVVDGQPTNLFARGAVGQAPVMWTASGSRATAVNFTANGLEAFESFEMFGPIDDLAASSSGRVLALVEGWVVERTGRNSWRRLDLGEPVRELRGRRGADGIWARTDARWLHFLGEEVFATDAPLGVDAREDDHGRLLTHGPDGLVRYSVGLPLLLLEVPVQNVLTSTTLRVVPTAVSLDPNLEVVATPVSGNAVTLEVRDYSVVLDPEVLGAGPWTLEATATYSDQTSTASAVVVMGADFAPTWTEHIEPIYREKCTPCHEGDQGILELRSEAQWIGNLLQGSTPDSEGIVDRVVSGNMPPSGGALTPTQKFLVLEWKDAILP